MLSRNIFVSLTWMVVAGSTVVNALAYPQTGGHLGDVAGDGTPRRITLADLLPADDVAQLENLPRNKPSTNRGPHGSTRPGNTFPGPQSANQQMGTSKSKRDLRLDEDTCPDVDMRNLLIKEKEGAIQMINYAANLTATHPIWLKLIEPAQASREGVIKLFQNRLKGLSDRIKANNDPIYLKCDQKDDPEKCTNTYTGDQDTISWSTPLKNEISVCSAIVNTTYYEDIKCVAGESIANYDSIATSILHEAIHVVWENDKDIFVRDVEYGWDDCVALAKGEYPEIVKGATLVNVDTFALLINNYYWYEKCGKENKVLDVSYCCRTCACRKG